MAAKDITGAFGSVKSEKSYLNARLDVQSARNKLFELNKELTLALRNFNSPLGAGKNYQASADAVKTAQAKVDAARIEVARVESLARAEYNRARRKVDAKKEKSETKKIDSEIERLQSNLQRAKDSGQSTTVIETQIKDLTDKKNKTGNYTPKTDVSNTGGVVGDQQGNAPGRDYLTEINNSYKTVYNMSAKDRKNLAQVLKAANYYQGPITGIYTDALSSAYQKAIQENSARSTSLGIEIPWAQFISDKTTEANLLGGGVGGGISVTKSRSISTKLEAAARVENIFKSELDRMPTPAEVEEYSAKLIQREKKESANVKTVTKTAGGVTFTETTGGLDRDQYLQNLVRKIPEYSDKKKQARDLTIQELATTAAANGFDLKKDFGSQVDVWAKQVEDGTDINVIRNLIRQSAKLGMPDKVGALLDQGVDLETIYAPYKRIMASVLEVNPDSISLNDPTLRMGIGTDKEMTLYDFQRALRKDPRWQYTDNARQETSDAVLGVLRDFGFQG